MDKDQKQPQWVLCPRCGAKTRVRLLQDTELKHFPLFCPKCRQESLIDAKHFFVSTVDFVKENEQARR